MPFSSLTDPADLARAHAAVEAAWIEVKPGIAPEDWEKERTRLIYIVSAFALIAGEEKELARRAVERFRKSKG